ncbi:hypothetical protein sscle_03g025330 [Sclerotinia sclerotiorum 1980 UF-70]|uniref:Uncharacterized protein n=1 Tax=Sclerotinia sclerotiorum (strain ATCC 18683 / 1980 / Ss-1) TaxID=665079 RepID=A0A1D9PZN6_SCLS1|nr:hypothetical protein sscle_03g025330 [Sclerotinia sclerotiorum 1980 UF-70]
MAISASGSQLGLPVLIVDDVVFLALASIAVFARIWARYIPKSKLCFNDYIISLALITRTEFYAVVRRRAGNKSQYVVVTGGAGQHMDKVQLSPLVSVFKHYTSSYAYALEAPDAVAKENLL